MNDTSDASAKLRHLWRRNSLIWLALVALLTATCFLAYQRLGALNGPVSLLIAAMKAGLVLALFMELLQARALVRLTALLGLVFLFVLFALSGTDFLTRP